MNRVRAPARGSASEASLSDQRTSQPAGDEDHDARLACAGDRDAFERLYRRHVGRIHGLSRRMAGGEAADDLTQDVFVRAWQKLHTFRSEARFGTWLYRLAINVIVEDRRRAANAWRRTGDETAVEKMPTAPADGVSAVDLAAALEQLPDGARQVFVLHDVEGYKHREIGKLVGITTGTSKGQLHRARAMLRRLLGRSDRMGGGHST